MLDSLADTSQKASTVSFKIKRASGPNYYVAWQPQFSPGGRYILFKYGASIPLEGPYDIFVFDTQTNELNQVTKSLDLAYDLISWSPDGNYIAFVRGGDVFGQTRVVHGSQVDYIGPLQLVVCNWRTGDTQEVATNDSLQGPFDWVPPHTLTYAVLDEATGKTSKSKIKFHPNIYRYSIEQKQSTLIAHDGWRPIPSPSGRKLAFFGTSHTGVNSVDDWEDFPSYVTLSISQLDGSQRMAIENEKISRPLVIWLPDETHLLTLNQATFGKKNFAQITEWNTATKTSRTVAALQSEDSEPIPRGNVDLAFRPLRLSKDGRTLFVSVSRIIGDDPLDLLKGTYLIETTVQAVDVASGKVTPLAKSIGASGVDWFDTSLPAPEH